MFKGYNLVSVNHLLESDVTFSYICDRIKCNRDVHCPYDGITFSVDRPPSQTLLRLIASAEYDDYNVIGKRRMYKHLLKHRLFILQWEPLSAFNNAPYTCIKINPNVNQITPSQLLDLIKFVVGGYHDVLVMRFDEKVDTDQYSTIDVAKRIYVAHKRSCNNYLKKNQTYYIGTRKGQQVKVYNKAEQSRTKGCKLVRIERTVKFSKVDRPLITSFLFDSRNDAFDNITMTDIKKLHHRSKLIRLIDQEGMLMKAYKLLKAAEKKAFRRHDAFQKPCLDLKQAFRKDLVRWINTSSNLAMKIWLDKRMTLLWNNLSNRSSCKVSYQFHVEPVPADVYIPNELQTYRILTGSSKFKDIFNYKLFDAKSIVLSR